MTRRSPDRTLRPCTVQPQPRLRPRRPGSPPSILWPLRPSERSTRKHFYCQTPQCNPAHIFDSASANLKRCLSRAFHARPRIVQTENPANRRFVGHVLPAHPDFVVRARFGADLHLCVPFRCVFWACCAFFPSKYGLFAFAAAQL